jgi:hypothetical protein
MLQGLRRLLRWPWKRKPEGSATLSAKIIRADGTVEDLGVVSRSPIEFKPEAK